MVGEIEPLCYKRVRIKESLETAHYPIKRLKLY